MSVVTDIIIDPDYQGLFTKLAIHLRRTNLRDVLYFNTNLQTYIYRLGIEDVWHGSKSYCTHFGKRGVGKSTLAFNLAGVLSRNGATALVDEDPIESCIKWAARGEDLPFQVHAPDKVDGALVDTLRSLVVDTEGRPQFEDVLKLIASKTFVLIPCGTSGLELDATTTLLQKLQKVQTPLERLRVVITKAPPVGTVGQQARDALLS